MEREKEIEKLVNVLRRAARAAMQMEWTGGNPEAAAYCVQQYNRVLERLKQIDPDLAPVFEPLPEGSSLAVASMACRQLAAYYEDEVRGGWKGSCGVAFDHRSFKEFWQRSAREVEDLGEFIRESVEEWVRRRREKPPESET